jgi:predicted RNase H-like nuclease (RuvC/YqgF family)
MVKHMSEKRCHICNNEPNKQTFCSRCQPDSENLILTTEKTFEDLLWDNAILKQQNAALAEENLALKQQLTEANAGIESISQHYREWIDSLEKEVAELREEHDSANACNTALWTLAGERRVALVKAMQTSEWCYACKEFDIHADDCDYVRLTKEDADGN